MQPHPSPSLSLMQSFILILLCTFSYFDYDWHIHISDRDRSQRSQWWENEWRDRNSLIQHPMHLNDQNERKGGWGKESIREQPFRLKELHSSLPVQMFPSPTLFEVNQDKGVIEESECKDTTAEYHQRVKIVEAQSIVDDRQENQRMRSKNSCR